MSLNLDKITSVVSEVMGVTHDEIFSRTRREPIVTARQLCYAVARNKTSIIASKIGVYYKRADHTTVLHGANRINREMDVNKRMREMVNHINSLLDQ